MKNIKTKKFVKFVSFALMVTCLLSATILPSFAANGSYYKTKTYTLNGTRGYCESNFAYNRATNCIMYGETRVVDGYSGTLTLQLNGVGFIIGLREKNTQTDGFLLSDTYTLDINEYGAGSLTSGCQGYVIHEIGSQVLCKYRGIWSSFEDGWSECYLADYRGLDQ